MWVSVSSCAMIMFKINQGVQGDRKSSQQILIYLAIAILSFCLILLQLFLSRATSICS